MLKNLFGDLSLDTTVKAVLRKLSMLSFGTSSSLRIEITNTPAVSVTTMTTGNIGYGDMGKNSTALVVNQQNFQCGVRRNFSKS